MNGEVLVAVLQSSSADHELFLHSMVSELVLEMQVLAMEMKRQDCSHLCPCPYQQQLQCLVT